MTKNMPEILAPAGDLERLKLAFNFGADAVYLGLQSFGLRTRAGNFSLYDLEQAVSYARAKSKKIYVTFNAFLTEDDFEGSLAETIKKVEEIGVDALIISDLGVLEEVRKVSPKLDIHLSTQATCLNSESSSFWKSRGVKRVILGRETSIEEASAIKMKTGLEVELFVQGAWCSSYSGQCTISNYTQGRDSNRGGCAHSCRFAYTVKKNGEQKTKQYFLSSQDMFGLELVGDLTELGIDSLKIEGRMKGPVYVALMSYAYKKALRGENTELLKSLLQEISVRGLSSAGLLPGGLEKNSSIEVARRPDNKNENLLFGVVLGRFEGRPIVDVRSNSDYQGELFGFSALGGIMKITSPGLFDFNFKRIEKISPGSVCLLEVDCDTYTLEEGDLLLKGEQLENYF